MVGRQTPRIFDFESQQGLFSGEPEDSEKLALPLLKGTHKISQALVPKAVVVI